MDSIIVTITDKSKSFFYDVEVPTSLETAKLKDDIVETLNGYEPCLHLNSAAICLFCSRINKRLNANETLAEAGVWNGDYITVTEV